MARYGTLGGGAAMSDAEIDALIAKEDPKSAQAQQAVSVQQQQVAVQGAQAQLAAAKRRAFIGGGVLVGVGLLAYLHFRDK